jgi:hypothetical protein
MLMTAAVLVALGAPAYAQVSLGGGGGDDKQKLEDIAEKQRQDQIDREYKSAIKRTAPVNQAAPSGDPWSTVRDKAADKTKR